MQVSMQNTPYWSITVASFSENPPRSSTGTPQDSLSDAFPHFLEYILFVGPPPFFYPIECINPTYDCLMGGKRLISMNLEVTTKFTPNCWNRLVILHVIVVSKQEFYRPQHHGFTWHREKNTPRPKWYLPYVCSSPWGWIVAIPKLVILSASPGIKRIWY